MAALLRPGSCRSIRLLLLHLLLVDELAHALASGAVSVVGVRPPTDVVPSSALLSALEAAGLRVVKE